MKKGSGRSPAAKTKPTREKQSSEEHRFRHLLPVLFLACATFLAYAAALKGTWALDDTAIGQYASIKNALTLHLGYRKIAYLSFLVNRWIDPVSPVNYRVTNILIHICNALLVYTIALKTMRLPAWKDKYGEYAFSAALLGATIFALHPININAVSYIVQRMASLSTMFVLLSLLSYISARISSGAFGAFALYGAAFLCIVCGIFSKENAIMAIPLIALYDAVFFFGLQRKRHIIKMGIGLIVGLLAVAASSVFLHFDKALLDIGAILLHPHQRIPDLGWTATDVYWTPAEHVLTEFRVIGRYLFLLFSPLPRFLVFDWWGFPLSAGIFSPFTTLISLLVIVCLISLAVVKFRKLPFLSFGILWYFIALALESFVALGSDLYFEHRNYLPLAGLAFGMTAEAVVVLKATATKRKSVWAAACMVALLLGGLTFQRNLVWKDSVTLWKDTVAKTTGNLRAVIALGNAYLKAADISAAKTCYKDAMKISAEEKRAHFFEDSAFSLGMVSLFTGDLAQAKKVISAMDASIEGSIRTSIVKGFYDALDGNYDGAISQYENILPSTYGLDQVIVYTLLGEAYSRKGLAEKAIASYEKAIALDPSFSAAYYGMATVYLGGKDAKKAGYYIEKTLSLDPSNVLALADMADILLITKAPPEEAEKFAARAVVNSPAFPTPYLSMGNVLVVMGKEKAAEEFYRKAADRGAKDYLIPYSKARAYFLKGEKEKVRPLLREVMSLTDTPEELKRSISGTLNRM
jgi:tetratricopeptide (TPR) repeat protein